MGAAQLQPLLPALALGHGELGRAGGKGKGGGWLKREGPGARLRRAGTRWGLV